MRVVAPPATVEARPGGVYRFEHAHAGRRDAHIDVFEPPRRLRLIHFTQPDWPAGGEAVPVDDVMLTSRDGGTVVVPTDGGAARVVGPTPDAAPAEPEGPTASAAAQFGAGSGSTTVSIPVRKSGAKAPVDATSERGSAARIPGGEPSADRTQPSQDSAESA